MPQVPQARNLVGIAETTDAKLRPADFGAGGELIGRAVEGLGQDIGQAAKGWHAYQEKVEDWQDDAATKEQVNAVNGFYSTYGFTGADPYYMKKGKEALTARPEFDKQLTTTIATARAQLKNDRQRRMFDDAVNSQKLSWGTQIAQHAQKEALSYDDDQSEARIGLAGELFRSTFMADPDHAEDQLATGIAEIRHRGEINGWSPEQVKVETLKFTSGGYRDIGVRLAYEGGEQGPALAEALVAKYGEVMTSDDREAVLTHARTQQNALEAEQRREEAEQRRLAREAKSDAKDRAQSVYRNIQDGVYVEPKQLAAAMADARTAEDPALEEGLRQGGLKNQLTYQYANATPAQLQDRVNELSTEITRQGGKVKPDLIVERDHLRVLLGKSNADLRADPLSWGAEHLGIALGPLNFNNPDSINNRILAARRISRETGAAPMPFTNEEAAQYTRIPATGSVKEKTSLALSLGRLGPLSLAAAQQIAPNDFGFQNLVGLASHRNAAVGRSRVNEVVSGNEALKTMPDLIKKDEATAAFNEFAGQAFYFLPSVKAGVLENAKAILANQASQRGYTKWTEAQGDWKPAINSALGGYGNGADRRGGLAKFNGAMTILPEDMTQAEFEARISRSNAPQFKAAHNGTPVFDDGKVPSSTDLKRLQWIPARDGVYRLSDGHGFLRTKETGDFYEINVRKLPPSGHSTLDEAIAAHGYVRR